MPDGLFTFFAALTLGAALLLVLSRNAVTSAMGMILALVGIAADFFLLDAYFLGVLQVLVYAGAVMVLFLFIIMLLDLKDEEKRARGFAPLAAGLALVVAFVVQLVGILSQSADKIAPDLDKQTLANAAAQFPKDSKIAEALTDGRLPDIHLIGHTLFTQYNLPLQLLGVLLLVATIGVVTLSKRQAD